ncbi:MAG: acylphosphatase [Thalassobaculaceae bacterium]
MAETRRLTVTGRVQGVGYRAWTLKAATELGLSGWVRNRLDGSVEIVARGEPAALDGLAERCRRGPLLSRVDGVEVIPLEDDPDLAPAFVQTVTA